MRVCAVSARLAGARGDLQHELPGRGRLAADVGPAAGTHDAVDQKPFGLSGESAFVHNRASVARVSLATQIVVMYAPTHFVLCVILVKCGTWSSALRGRSATHVVQRFAVAGLGVLAREDGVLVFRRHLRLRRQLERRGLPVSGARRGGGALDCACGCPRL